jgi:hypothetical protein
LKFETKKDETKELTKDEKQNSEIIEITKDQLLYFVYKKQGLINRLNSFSKKKIDFIFPLHATNSTTPFYSLFARIKNFDKIEDSEKKEKNVEKLETNKDKIENGNKKIEIKKDEKKIENWLKYSKDINDGKFELIRCIRGTLHIFPSKRML